MSNTVLSIDNIGKSYNYFSNEWKRIFSWFTNYIKPREVHWVLRDISFVVERGESFGIVGQNGAGKSTLLKVIAGVLKPSLGNVVIFGRIAAILELGMGFHQDFTGRQNVIKAGGLLGFSPLAMKNVMPEIESFAEIHDYFDQPMRTYSSGMLVRVAFAVATAFRPDILIVDEALSVGDAYFQHKCFERIRSFQAQGTTLLIVSHDKSIIQGLCNKVVLLDKGSIVSIGDPRSVMDYYNALIVKGGTQNIKQTKTASNLTQTVSGTGEARVEEAGIFNLSGQHIDDVSVGERVELRFKVKAHSPIDRLIFGFVIRDRFGESIYGTNTFHTNQIIKNIAKNTTFLISIYLNMNLGPATYSISTSLSSEDVHISSNYEWKDIVLLFSVVNVSNNFFIGSTWLIPEISITTALNNSVY